MVLHIVAFREVRIGRTNQTEMQLVRRMGKVCTYDTESDAREAAGMLGVVNVMTAARVKVLDQHPERAWNWVPNENGKS